MGEPLRDIAVDVTSFDVNRDIYYGHLDDSCVWIMKRFPMGRCINAPAPLRERDYYHLRFYLPTETVLDSNARIERIVIMTNGLDEILRFKLYDELGCRLARQGCASVLVPVFYHLNRHPRYRERCSLSASVSLPSKYLRRRPGWLLEMFRQFCAEVDLLVDHFDGAEFVGETADHDRQFFDLFSQRPQVSLLGFSLGGMFARGILLKRTDRFNAAFMLNSSVSLQETHAEGIMSDDEWHAFIGSVQTLIVDDNTDELRAFRDVFVHPESNRAAERLEKLSDRMLFTFGARDKLVGPESLRRLISGQSRGLAYIVLPGTRHFLADDVDWERSWLDFYIRTLLEFDDNAAKERVVPGALPTKGSPDILSELRRSLVEVRKPDPSAGLLPSRQDVRNKIKAAIDSGQIRTLLLGELCYHYKLITFAQLQAAVAASDKSVQFGEVMWKRLRLLSRCAVENVARKQQNLRDST